MDEPGKNASFSPHVTEPARLQPVNSWNESVACRTLLEEPGLAHLGPEGRPHTRPANKLRDQIRSLPALKNLSPRAQELIIGAVLLWHDHLDEAHGIAQNIEDADGS